MLKNSLGKSGYIGEYIAHTASALVATTGTFLSSITLTPGIWMVFASAQQATTVNNFGSYIQLEKLGTLGTTNGYDFVGNENISNGNAVSSETTPPNIVQVTSATADKTCRVKAYAITTAVTMTSYLIAIRIGE